METVLGESQRTQPRNNNAHEIIRGKADGRRDGGDGKMEQKFDIFSTDPSR